MVESHPIQVIFWEVSVLVTSLFFPPKAKGRVLWEMQGSEKCTSDFGFRSFAPSDISVNFFGLQLPWMEDKQAQEHVF